MNDMKTFLVFKRKRIWDFEMKSVTQSMSNLKFIMPACRPAHTFLGGETNFPTKKNKWSLLLHLFGLTQQMKSWCIHNPHFCYFSLWRFW